MADLMALMKKQSEKGIAELRDLSAKLSEQLKHLINLIPENTRQKSIEAFLNDIRTSVLGEAPRPSKRVKKPSTPKRTVKVGKVTAKRGSKKKKVSPVIKEQKPT
jgi:hypothetical protein